MGFYSGVKKAVKPLVDVPRWLDVNRLMQFGTFIGTAAKRAFTFQKPEQKETFEQALARLKITEKDLAHRKREFTRLLVIYLIAFIAIFSYGIYLFSTAHIKAGTLALAISLIPLVQIFRFHFWLFQIKSRKLGCSVREWFYYGILRKAK
ncbi:MAG: type IVB secretion system protein IcmV [Gammaproteobacteria bacterium]